MGDAGVDEYNIPVGQDIFGLIHPNVLDPVRYGDDLNFIVKMQVTKTRHGKLVLISPNAQGHFGYV